MERKKRRKKITRKKKDKMKENEIKKFLKIIINEKFIPSSPFMIDANATIFFSILAGSSYLSISIFQVLPSQVLSFIILIYQILRKSFLSQRSLICEPERSLAHFKNVSILLTE